MSDSNWLPKDYNPENKVPEIELEVNMKLKDKIHFAKTFGENKKYYDMLKVQDVKKHIKAFLEELKKCKADTITGNKFLILSEEWLDEIAQKHFGGIEE